MKGTQDDFKKKNGVEYIFLWIEYVVSARHRYNSFLTFISSWTTILVRHLSKLSKFSWEDF